MPGGNLVGGRGARGVLRGRGGTRELGEHALRGTRVRAGEACHIGAALEGIGVQAKDLEAEVVFEFAYALAAGQVVHGEEIVARRGGEGTLNAIGARLPLKDHLTAICAALPGAIALAKVLATHLDGLVVEAVEHGAHEVCKRRLAHAVGGLNDIEAWLEVEVLVVELAEVGDVAAHEASKGALGRAGMGRPCGMTSLGLKRLGKPGAWKV